LYCFFVIEPDRRRILRFNVTRHPSADWIVQQLRETFAEAAPYRYAILDHDASIRTILDGRLVPVSASLGRHHPRRTRHAGVTNTRAGAASSVTYHGP
jgi:hypothetical protein